MLQKSTKPCIFLIVQHISVCHTVQDKIYINHNKKKEENGCNINLHTAQFLTAEGNNSGTIRFLKNKQTNNIKKLSPHLFIYFSFY